MATEVGVGYVTIHPQMSNDFDSKIKSKLSSSGSSGGKSFGGAFSVAAGNLLSAGIEKTLATLSAHMDSAISRADALNQFPKVMQNIGFSGDQASAAIKKLAAGIDGLPTTLDDIVGNTQQLALSLGDLDTASDVAIALNDGFLMFGASSADVTNAITQLNQMITAGKYDMQSWNSINQAAPGFLDAVASSMLGAGSKASDLRDALNNGKVSSEDFMAAIVNLDKNGMDGMTSFSEGVKSATGGIETSLGRIDSAITRNLANIVDFAAQNVGLVDICNSLVEAINAVGNGIITFLNSAMIAAGPLVADLMANVQALGESLSPWLMDAVNAIGAVIQGTLIVVITAAIAIFNAIIGVIATVISFFTDFGANVEAVCMMAQGAMDSFSAGANAAFSAFTSFVGNAISSVWSAITGFVGNIASAVSNIASTIGDGLSNLASQAFQWGSDIIQGLIDGIMGMLGSLASAAGEAAGMIAGFLHFSEPDVGPLSNFHTFMPDMMKLMAEGIHKNVRLVRREVEGVAGMIGDGFNIDGSVSMPSGNSYNFNGITINAQDRSMDEVFNELISYANRSRVMMGVR